MDVSNAQRNSILHALPQPQTTTRHGTWHQGYVELGHQRYVQYIGAFFTSPTQVSAMSKPFRIEHDNEEIVVRFNRTLVDSSVLSRLLNYVEFSALQMESEITSEEIHALADEVDAAVWQHVKDKYTE